MERHPFLVRAFKGSNPFIPEDKIEYIAQQVEHRTFNPQVLGSNPNILKGLTSIFRVAYLSIKKRQRGYKNYLAKDRILCSKLILSFYVLHYCTTQSTISYVTNQSKLGFIKKNIVKKKEKAKTNEISFDIGL